jgi:glycosyltransferase involved in cell wall biosynthesis
MLVPVLRDMFLLPVWRLLARKVVYHFRAGGLSELIRGLPAPFQVLAKLAYGKPDAAILLSAKNPDDAKFLQARRVYIVPNGLEDNFTGKTGFPDGTAPVSLCYMGLLSEEKGIFVLLDAFDQLCKAGLSVRLHLAGEFDGNRTKRIFLEQLGKRGMNNMVVIHGLLTGEKKWEFYRSMDILCFLSHYRAETFGNSILEAMIWQMPVVATQWRGIPDLVTDGYNGYLVPVRDAQAAAEKMKILIQNADLRNQFGRNGRGKYLREFTLEKHLSQMENVFLETAGYFSAG